MSSMAKVKVFYDGTYEVEEVNDNATTQHLYITEKGKFGEVYVCPKEYVEKYNIILFCIIIRKNYNKIIEVQNQNEKLRDLFLTNID